MPNDFLATGGGDAPAGGAPAAPGGSTGGGPGAAGGAPAASSSTPVGTGATTPAAGGSTPPAAGGATLADGATPQATEPTWPADWRQKLAGDDKAYLKTLERFTDPAGLAKAYRDAQTKLSSGQLKTAMPGETATPEEIATWRKENGIPDAPTGYIEKLALPDGVVPGEADKPLLDAFASRLHGKNVSPEVFNEAVSWYYETQDAQQREILAQDSDNKRAATDLLNKEWGGEFRANMNGISNFLKTQFDDATLNEMLGARGPSGRPLGDNPGFLKAIAALAKDQNPYASLMPAGTTDPIKGGEARIAEIESVMKTDAAKYWKDTKMQSELRDLYAARDKMTARG